MNKRENLLSLFKKRGFNEVPVDFDLCPDLLNSFQHETGWKGDYKDYFQMPWRNVNQLKVKGLDKIDYRSYYDFTLKENTYIDEWGVAHEPGSEAAKHMTYMRNPLRNADSREQIMSYPLPDYDKDDFVNQVRECEAIKARGLAPIGTMTCTIWERSWYIRSMEELMMDMMVEDEKAQILLDRVTNKSIEMAESFAKAGVDILYIGDDIGMQSSIMMSEELYVTWIKPRLKRVIDAAKKVNPELIILYHSCGFVTPLIPHLIDAGINILNPIQPECMDFYEINSEFGDKVSFYGTIGTQKTMPFGTPKEVKQEVFKNLKIAGDKGGLLPAPTHLLEPEVPWENIYAYVEACNEYFK